MTTSYACTHLQWQHHMPAHTCSDNITCLQTPAMARSQTCRHLHWQDHKPMDTCNVIFKSPLAVTKAQALRHQQRQHLQTSATYKKSLQYLQRYFSLQSTVKLSRFSPFRKDSFLNIQKLLINNHSNLLQFFLEPFKCFSGEYSPMLIESDMHLFGGFSGY